MEGLKGGGALRIKAVADGGEPVQFTVSLEGFTGAHDRVVALTR